MLKQFLEMKLLTIRMAYIRFFKQTNAMHRFDLDQKT